MKWTFQFAVKLLFPNARDIFGSYLQHRHIYVRSGLTRLVVILLVKSRGVRKKEHRTLRYLERGIPRLQDNMASDETVSEQSGENRDHLGIPLAEFVVSVLLTCRTTRPCYITYMLRRLINVTTFIYCRFLLLVLPRGKNKTA